MEKPSFAVVLALSVTVTLSVKVPACVGVPVICPLLELMDRPEPVAGLPAME